MSDYKKCQCSMVAKVIGNGCQYCNPEMHVEIMDENAAEADAEIAALKARIEELEAERLGTYFPRPPKAGNTPAKPMCQAQGCDKPATCVGIHEKHSSLSCAKHCRYSYEGDHCEPLEAGKGWSPKPIDFGALMGDAKRDVAFWREKCELLESRIGELEAANRWIPVGEGLPEWSESVTVITITGKVHPARHMGGVFYWLGMPAPSHPWPTLNVTHWRPMPEPPEVTE